MKTLRQVTPGLLISSTIEVNHAHADIYWIIKSIDSSQVTLSVKGHVLAFTTEEKAQKYIDDVGLIKQAAPKRFSWNELLEEFKTYTDPKIMIDATLEDDIYQIIPLQTKL